MTERRAGDRIDEREGRGTTVRRRGILAAAGVALAGLLAKQTSQPVAANPGNGDQGAMFLGSNPFYKQSGGVNTPNVSNVETVLQAAPNFSTFVGQNGLEPTVLKVDGSTGAATNTSVDAIVGIGSGAAGVGVRGVGVPAVLGNGFIGVQGISSAGGVGLYGVGTGTGIGVYGTTETGSYAVYGHSGKVGGVGVFGYCDIGGTALYGTVSTGIAVLGVASGGNGIRGYSEQNHAVIGQTTGIGYGGVFGVATLDNTVGVYGSTFNGTSYNASAFAGYMDGNFVVANGFKSAAVKHTDGTHRLVYCMESPENWFEDFGKAKLVNGRAEVKLDADFAAIVQTDDYHIFLTTYGESNGLYIAKQSGGGFSVQERNKGTNSLPFSYRIVAKRKDISAARLARFDLVGKAKIDVTAPKRPPLPVIPTSREKG